MAKRILAIGLALVVMAGIGIQFVPYGRNHANPPVRAEPQWSSAQTRAQFMTSCGDCHSNETQWQWYSNIAPMSWLIQRDVDEGRRKLNISEWGLRRQEAGESAETVTKGEMPPRIYFITHPEAALAGAARDAFVSGLTATFGGERERGSRPAQTPQRPSR